LIELSNLWDFFAVTVDEKVAKDATPLVKFISSCHKTCNDMSISEITWGPLPFVYQWAVLKIKSSSQKKTKNFGKRLDKRTHHHGKLGSDTMNFLSNGNIITLCVFWRGEKL